MLITDEMLADISEIIIECKRVTMVLSMKREFIFTNGWQESNQIGSKINTEMLRAKKKRIRHEG